MPYKSRKNRLNYLLASSIATATATVIPTMGLLPAPIFSWRNSCNPFEFPINYKKLIAKKARNETTKKS